PRVVRTWPRTMRKTSGATWPVTGRPTLLPTSRKRKPSLTAMTPGCWASDAVLESIKIRYGTDALDRRRGGRQLAADVDRAGGRPHRSGDQGLDQLRHDAGRKPAHHSGTAALHVLVQSRRGLWAVSVPAAAAGHGVGGR